MRARAALLSGSMLVTLGAALPASAALPTDAPIEPWADHGMRITWAGAGTSLGVFSLDSGDINGDGVPDIVAGAAYADLNGRTDSGAVVVVFGGAGSADVSAAALGERGFRIAGAVAGEQLGYFHGATVVGDVNGDGYDDIVATGPDTAYLVFGRAGTTDIDLGLPSAAFVTLSTSEAGSTELSKVGGAGDVNVDGYRDFFLADPYTDTGSLNAGSAWLIYGQATWPGTVDLSMAATSVDYTRIDGTITQGNLGFGANSPGRGDWNADGIDDVLIAAPFAATAAGGSAGVAYVIFGAEGGLGAIDLAALGADGVTIPGIRSPGGLGESGFAWVGDITGAADTFHDDVILSASYTELGGVPNAGEAYVVPGGSAGTVDLAAADVVRLYDGMPNISDYFGYGANRAGDVNGDGWGDILVANAYQDAGGVVDAGQLEVLYGPLGPEDVDFGVWSGDLGIRFHGVAVTDLIGYGDPTPVGDFNGDGGQDIAFSRGAEVSEGGIYVYFGNPSPFIDIAGDGMPGRTLTFTASSADDPILAPAEWDFGDGTAPVSSGLTTAHAFASSGRKEVLVFANDADGGIGFGVTLAFPCLTTSPFTDLPATGFGNAHIGCLRDLGVVSGTGATTYSPGQVVTREQMAVFLMTTYELYYGSEYNGNTVDFADIASSFAATRIRQLAGLGITSGTSAGIYSPTGVVTREQMAVFLMNLYEQLTFAPYTGPTQDFTDIASSFAVTRIRQLAGLGITSGTSPGVYSPTTAVTREQMAVFIVALLEAAAAGGVAVSSE